MLNPRTFNQRRYMDLLYSSVPVIIGTGPAGTGKTLLACHAGSKALMDLNLLHPADKWYHVAAVYDGKEYSNYVNGKLLVAGGGQGGKSGLVVAWDIATGERVITIGDQFDAVLAADLSADQRLVALGGPDRVLKIYSTKDGELVQRVRKHTDWVTSTSFSPDGVLLATGDRNGGVVVWDSEVGQEVQTFTGHRGAITALNWRSPDILVTASEDGTVKTWSVKEGAQVKSANAHNAAVSSTSCRTRTRTARSSNRHRSASAPLIPYAARAAERNNGNSTPT